MNFRYRKAAGQLFKNPLMMLLWTKTSMQVNVTLSIPDDTEYSRDTPYLVEFHEVHTLDDLCSFR